LGIAAGLSVAAALLRHLDVVEVSGGSMAPTLLPGDRLLVEAVSYRLRPPRTGEVVLAADPRQPDRELVKRVAAVSTDGLELAGDAPDASTDSRAFGPVPSTSIRWRVVCRYWPIGRRRA
jgi:nickel-type superoxide dismutase maturation protease